MQNGLHQNAAMLLTKLQTLKKPDNKPKQALKNLTVQFEKTAQQMLTQIEVISNRTTHIATKVHELKTTHKQEEKATLRSLENFESALAKSLHHYEEQSIEAECRMRELLTTYQEEFKLRRQKQIQSTEQELSSYRNLTKRIEQLEKELQAKQTQNLGNYERISQAMQKNMTILIQKVRIGNNQVLLKQDKLIQNCDCIESELNSVLKAKSKEKEVAFIQLRQEIQQLFSNISFDSIK